MRLATRRGPEPRERRGAPPAVALVEMPFRSTRYPSVQLGLLQATLARHGIRASTVYLNLCFARRIGWEAYESLCDPWCRLLGEWIFAEAAFGAAAPDARALLDAFPVPVAMVCGELGVETGDLLRLRQREAPAFVEECLAAVPWGGFGVVAFGSVFEQNCAALALARRLKEQCPATVTVFGGANFEDEMGLEYVRALPWIDYAVIGEGDRAFPDLLARLAAGGDPAGLPGVACRRAGEVVFGGRAALVQDLDALPVPDYDDFFRTAAELDLPGTIRGAGVQIPFESARGCWWGAKHHCTFCGLNALGMAYRSKTPARLLTELDEQARRYGRPDFFSVDNIMDPRYVDGLFGALADRGRPYTFFYEAKANLTREQLATLVRGGVRRMTVGIESLDTRLLQLMRKGVTGIQNVRLLRWAAALGLQVSWHLLVGFPGECPEDYARQLATVRLIPHLPPPAALVRIRLDRFSPYFADPGRWGLADVRPDRAYGGVYPGELDLRRIAYSFEYDAPATVPSAAHTPLHEHVRWWQGAHRDGPPPSLTYVGEGTRLLIRDARRPDRPPVHHALEGVAALAYESCSATDHAAARVLEHVRARGMPADLASVETGLETLTAQGLMLAERGRYLSLALPACEGAPRPGPPGADRPDRRASGG